MRGAAARCRRAPQACPASDDSHAALTPINGQGAVVVASKSSSKIRHANRQAKPASRWRGSRFRVGPTEPAGVAERQHRLAPARSPSGDRTCRMSSVAVRHTPPPIATVEFGGADSRSNGGRSRGRCRPARRVAPAPRSALAGKRIASASPTISSCTGHPAKSRSPRRGG